MVTAIIQHEVNDFAEWKKVFDQDVPNLATAGVKLLGVYTSVKNPNDVTMIFEAPDAGIYDVLMSDPNRQAEIKRGGVIGAPNATFLNKID
jgi:hypothetical protein